MVLLLQNLTAQNIRQIFKQRKDLVLVMTLKLHLKDMLVSNGKVEMGSKMIFLCRDPSNASVMEK